MNLEEYVPVLNDLASVSYITYSKDTEFHSHNVVHEKVGNTKLYLEVPDDVKNKLLSELPEMNKKIDKLKLEIGKLKNKMNKETVTTNTMDISKVNLNTLLRAIILMLHLFFSYKICRKSWRH